MHHPLRNAAVTHQTQQGKAMAGSFFFLNKSIYERVISHGATPLDAGGQAKGVRIN